MFKDLKISVRLGLAFGVVSLLLASVVVMGVTRLADVAENTDDMVIDKYPKVLWSYTLIGNINEIAMSMRNIAIYNDAQTVRKELVDIETAKTSIREQIAKLEKRITSAQGKDLLRAMLDAREKYRVHQEEFIRLSGESKLAEAKDLLTNQLAGAQANYISSLSRLITYQSELMEKSGQEAAAEYKEARNMMITLGTLAVLFGIAMAFWITLSITRQLGGEPGYAAELLKRIAAGDLSGEVVTRKGDKSSMLLAVGGMVAKLRQVIDGQRAVVEAANRGNFDVRVDMNGLQGFQQEMGDGLNQLVGTVGASIDDVVRVMGALSDGDLSKKIDKDYQGAFAKLKDYSNNTMDKLAQVVGEVNSSAQSLASASEEVSATAQSLSQAASEQAAGVEETSASLEQMTASISQNTENARVTDGMAAKAAPKQPKAAKRSSHRRRDEADRQADRHHRRHRLPDQPAGAECRDRSGARRRTRQGLRGGGGRGAQAGRTQPGGGAGNRRSGTSSVELAERAGKLLDQMVPNIRKTSDLVQEITAASEEQSAGVGQINARWAAEPDHAAERLQLRRAGGNGRRDEQPGRTAAGRPWPSSVWKAIRVPPLSPWAIVRRRRCAARAAARRR
jgi:methyl-accepting chemotaxis protein